VQEGVLVISGSSTFTAARTGLQPLVLYFPRKIAGIMIALVLSDLFH